MSAVDDFGQSSSGLDQPIRGGAAVTPDDNADLTKVSRALYAGSTGDLAVVMASGDELTFSNFPAGVPFPIRVKRVKATGTTASSILALW